MGVTGPGPRPSLTQGRSTKRDGGDRALWDASRPATPALLGGDGPDRDRKRQPQAPSGRGQPRDTGPLDRHPSVRGRGTEKPTRLRASTAVEAPAALKGAASVPLSVLSGKGGPGPCGRFRRATDAAGRPDGEGLAPVVAPALASVATVLSSSTGRGRTRRPGQGRRRKWEIRPQGRSGRSTEGRGRDPEGRGRKDGRGVREGGAKRELCVGSDDKCEVGTAGGSLSRGEPKRRKDSGRNYPSFAKGRQGRWRGTKEPSRGSRSEHTNQT